MEFHEADAIRRQILDENEPLDAAVLLGQMFAQSPEFFQALHHREIAPGIRISNPGPDASTMTERYISGVAATADRYVQGMQNPRRNPVEAAKRAAGKWANNVTKAIQEKSYEAGVGSQNYAEGVQIATEDGGAAWSSGATKRRAKVERSFARLAPLLGGLSQSIQNMPQDNDAQREARLLAALRGMRNIGKQMKRGGGA